LKQLNIRHKVCDFTCMTNGIEDLYENATGIVLPPYFLFGLSGFCSPAYIKSNSAKAPRMFYPNAAQPKRLFEFIKETLNLKISVSEDRSFSFAFTLAKKAIDEGKTVLIGACDMFHLGYLDKFYHNSHIPIHYFLMIGYDDTTEEISLLDCSRESVQRLSYSDLQMAWDTTTPGFSRKNTLRVIELPSNLPNTRSIFFESIKKKTTLNLGRVPDFIGVSAITKLAREISHWQIELSAEEYYTSLLHLVEYCGFPPTVPDIEANDATLEITHTAGRKHFADLLMWGADTFSVPRIRESAELFEKSGNLYAVLAKEVLGVLQTHNSVTDSIPTLLNTIAMLEKQANEILKDI